MEGVGIEQVDSSKMQTRGFDKQSNPRQHFPK